MFSIVVTEEEFLTLADELRPYTEKAMKIEPAPWIKDYMVDMDYLYTELTLEKIDNEPHQQLRRKLENYKELFPFEHPKNVETGAPPATPPSYTLAILKKLFFRSAPPITPLPTTSPPSEKKRKKILFKGDPGRGKTTLSKKIAWDWAKGLFTSVSIIFFVFLKLVKPGDAIENVIIEQTPALQGLHVTKEKIASILETFGDQCLVIFDGLDEYAFGQNEDVLKIVKDAKWLHCNVIVTSRPHSTKQIEGYCDTIVSVEGFTRGEAKKFASSMVPDQKKVEQILDFNPNRLEEGQYLHNVPILLSFLCVLVREDDIDLTDSRISIGEIYWRMFICLYKKFTIRKAINFDMSSFVEVLRSLGKLALDTLFRAPFFQRSQVIKEVGDDVFDYGLLIGHEDFRLIRDETSDILVTFPHRSLQEFLGAFYFILALQKETDMHKFVAATNQFMTNPLFHQFCLWFLDCRQLSEICPSWNRQRVYELLSSYAAAQINHAKIDLKDTMNRFPAFQVALEDKNQKALAMLSTILGKCYKVRHLGIGFKHPAGQILSSLGPLFKSIRSIQVPEVKSNLEVKFSIDANYRKEIRSGVNNFDDMINPDNDLNVIVRGERGVHCKSVLGAIYKVCEQWKRSPFVYINLPDQANIQFELSELLDGTMKGLHLFGGRKIVCHQEIQYCPMLTHLSLNGASLMGIFGGLVDALQNSKFPRLSHLNLAKCHFGSEGRLSSLFQSKCSTLEHLDLFGLDLEEPDLHFLHSVMTDSENCVLPSLSSLVLDTLTLQQRSSLSIMFQNPWTKMRKIRCEGHRPPLFNSPKHHHKISDFISIINESKLPNLTTLCFERVEGDLDQLDEQKIPHLNSLTLRSFRTSSPIILTSLVKKMRTWKLEKLDISGNNVRGDLSALVSNILPSLKSLIVTHCELNSHDIWSLGIANEKGRLPELKYLDLSDNETYNDKMNITDLLPVKFPSLQGLIVRKCFLNKNDLRSLARANAAGKLPELRQLDISVNSLEESLELLTRDPKTHRKLSWRSVKCDDKYLSIDHDSGDDDDSGRDPETGRPLSWRGEKCDDVYLSNDDDSDDD